MCSRPLVLGFDAVPIAISAGIYFWHSILLHANVRLSFGPLRWVIASPVFHHWHHAARPDAQGKNFAGQLSVLDKLFGTMYMPAGQTPERSGLDEPVPNTYISQMLYPFKLARLIHERRPKWGLSAMPDTSRQRHSQTARRDIPLNTASRKSQTKTCRSP